MAKNKSGNAGGIAPPPPPLAGDGGTGEDVSIVTFSVPGEEHIRIPAVNPEVNPLLLILK